MKKIILLLTVSFISAISSNGFANKNKVEISGEKAQALFFELEKSGATMAMHTPRVTEYMTETTSCVAEEQYNEDGSRSGVASFTCSIYGTN